MAPISKHSRGKKVKAYNAARKETETTGTGAANKGGDLVVQTCKGCKKTSDPLMKACAGGNLELVRALLEFDDRRALARARVRKDVIDKVMNKEITCPRTDGKVKVSCFIFVFLCVIT